MASYCRTDKRSCVFAVLLFFLLACVGVVTSFANESILQKESEENCLKLFERVSIQEIAFTETPLGQVTQALNSILKDQKLSGFRFVALEPHDSLVSLHLSAVNLAQFLELLLEQLNLEIEIKGDLLILKKVDPTKPRLITKRFPLSRSAVIQMTGLEERLASPEPAIALEKNQSQVSNSAHLSQEIDQILSAINHIQSQSEYLSASEIASMLQSIEQKELKVKTGLLSLAESGQKLKINSNLYLEELAIKSFLERSGIDFSPSLGSKIAFDGAFLIVTHNKKELEKIENLLSNYQKLKQVCIQIRFMEVADGALKETGMKFQANDRKRKRTSGVQIANEQSKVGSSLGQTLGLLGKEGTNLLTVNGILGRVELTSLLKALEQSGQSELMSSPQITVLSGAGGLLGPLHPRGRKQWLPAPEAAMRRGVPPLPHCHLRAQPAQPRWAEQIGDGFCMIFEILKKVANV
jgi:type II secretory pathway component GspD/PulD (secretin)